MKPTVNVFFIIEGDRLEAQACILAPSLKRYLSENQKAIAYIPKYYWPKLSTFTRTVLERCDIEARLLPEALVDGEPAWSEPYPYGNKIIAAYQPRNTDISVFIDTDTVLMQPCDFAEILGENTICAVISDYATGALDEEFWRDAYAGFKLPLPEERVQYLRGKNVRGLPYYNGGMIIFKEDVIAYGEKVRFSEVWLGVASQISHSIPREKTDIFIDQISLPIAGYLISKPVTALDKRYNYNIQGHPIAADEFPEIVHYHKDGVLWDKEHLAQRALSCLCDVMGPNATFELAQTFDAVLKRKRLKRYFKEA